MNGRDVPSRSTRLSALTRLAAELGTLADEGQLEAAFERAVEVLFAPDARATSFLETADDLVSVVDGRSVRLLVDAPSLHSLRTPQLLASDARRHRGAKLLAPMIVHGRLSGVVAIERPYGAPEFEPVDLETLVAMAGQYGLALFELRRHITLRRVELNADLEEARAVQRRFLPSLPPRIGPLRIAAAYRPAHDVGGDFYDLVMDSRGRAVVVIGDVSGCGVAAALVMSRISAELHRIAATAGCPSHVLSALNAFAIANLPDHAFVTAECLVIDLGAHAVSIANAGHVPTLVRRRGGRVEIHGEDAGVPLGFVPEGRWNEQRFVLEERDVVLLSTDGVVEGLNHDRSPGLSRVAAILGAVSGDVTAVNRALLAALDETPQHHLDDVTLLSLCLMAGQSSISTSSFPGVA